MRRSLLVVLALVAGLVTAVTPAQAAVPGRCDAPALQRYGPASVTAAIVGAAVYRNHAYVVTRGLKPVVLAEIDLATRKVVRSVTLPDGPATGEPEGGWATTVSGGKIYVGTYPSPDLYSFDPATGEVKHLHSFGAYGGFVWTLTTAPDGTIYAGTSSDGRAWEYKPDTGAVRRFGVLAPGERYVRAISADATTVYAGLLDKGKLMAIDRVSGAVKELAAGTAGIGAMADHGDRILAAGGSTLIDVRKDGTDARKIQATGTLDMITVAPDGTAYLTSRPDGAVHRYRTGDSALTKVAEPPSLGDETRGLHLVDADTLVGFSGSGGMWWLDLRTGKSEFIDLIDAGLTPGPERPQSMLLVPNRAVYIGGHFSMEVRDLRDGSKRRFRIPGEPKDLVRHGDKIYAAIYPSGQILEIDIHTDQTRSLGYLGHGQQRPWDIEFDKVTGKLVVASAPLGANLNGALSVVDPVTGAMDVYTGILSDQALMSLSLGSDGIVYLGGDVLGGGGTPPTKTSASVAAFDLKTRELLWQVDPVQGGRTFQDIKVHEGILYASYKRVSGEWIAMDLATRTVKVKGMLSGYGELTVHRGKVFASVFRGTGNAYQLGPDLTEAKLLASGLGEEWYTNPQLHFEPGSWNAWAMAGRDLARIRLDPACPPLTIPPAQS